VATGGIIIAVIMLLVFPVLIMFGGAIWSALMGKLFVEDAEARANAEAPPVTE
jgi:flagellar basal body-associated protein FliL